MHTFFRRKSHPSPPTQYITMRTPIFPSPREAVTVVPIHTLYMNSSVPFWKNANLLSMTSWALTGQVQESVRTNPLWRVEKLLQFLVSNNLYHLTLYHKYIRECVEIFQSTHSLIFFIYLQQIIYNVIISLSSQWCTDALYPFWNS